MKFIKSEFQVKVIKIQPYTYAHKRSLKIIETDLKGH